MTYEQLIADLQNKIYKPIYLLTGEESYYIDKVLDFIEENILDEAEKSFNMTVVYGKDTDSRTVDSAAKRFPMMSNYQLVIVKEAHEMKDIENLAFYAEKPLKSTILVIVYKYKALDKRKKLYKLIEKSGVIFESPKLYDNKIPAWITSYLAEKKLSIRPEASVMLSEFLGTDLGKIANELNKLAILLPEGTTVTPDHVEKNIGISKDYNVFELQKALGMKDILKTNRIVNYFEHNNKDAPMVVIVSSLFTYFSQLLKVHSLKDGSQSAIASALGINPYFVKDYLTAKTNYPLVKVIYIISLLREFDLKSKGVNSTASEGQLLKELTFKILHI